MQIHGTEDDVVPYEGNMWMAPIEEVLDFWRTTNLCTDEETVLSIEDSNTTDASTVEHQLNHACNENTTIEFFKVIDGTHTWPGSAIDFGVTNYDINATEEIWRFFSQYNLDGPLSRVAEKIEVQLDYKIYPTLVYDNINIEIDSPGQKRVQIVDPWGRRHSHCSSDDNFITVNTSQLSKGTYILLLELEDIKVKTIFVKN